MAALSHIPRASSAPHGSDTVTGPARGERAHPERDRALILVVDDEPQIVDFVSALLEEEGYRVRAAYNGREALSAIHQEAPNLVISDVMMPVSSGIDLLRQLDASAPQPSPRVILMSAVAQRSPRAGVPFIQKPFDIDDLLALVDGALDGEMRRSA